MARQRQFRASYPAALSDVFMALAVTLAFRRWPLADELPPAGSRYRHAAGSVQRVGRIVDIVRPCGLTLEEVLHDPPCRVGLFMRWRIEPMLSGAAVRLDARYRFNHAAAVRALHWDRRLHAHFNRQLRFIGKNLQRLQQQADGSYARNSRYAGFSDSGQ